MFRHIDTDGYKYTGLYTVWTLSEMTGGVIPLEVTRNRAKAQKPHYSIPLETWATEQVICPNGDTYDAAI